MTTQNNKSIVWTLDKILQTKIEFATLIMAEIKQEDELGQKLYKILEVYLHMLIRAKHRFTMDAEEFEEMKSTIHSLDEMFHELQEQPEATGWFFGIQAGNNIVYSLCNMLIQVRNELLLSIAYYMEGRKASSL